MDSFALMLISHQASQLINYKLKPRNPNDSIGQSVIWSVYVD